MTNFKFFRGYQEGGIFYINKTFTVSDINRIIVSLREQITATQQPVNEPKVSANVEQYLNYLNYPNFRL